MSTILPYKNILPRIDKTAFIASTATIIGDVEIGSNSSIWFGTVIRGDVNNVKIGKNTNIQDNSVIHVSTDGQGCYIGDNVTVGHMAMLHGCTVGEGSLVGIGSVVLNGAKIGRNCLIGAKAFVREGMEVPDGSMVLGIPGKVVRQMSEEQIKGINGTAFHYQENWRNMVKTGKRVD